MTDPEAYSKGTETVTSLSPLVEHTIKLNLCGARSWIFMYFS